MDWDHVVGEYTTWYQCLETISFDIPGQFWENVFDVSGAGRLKETLCVNGRGIDR